MRNASVQNKAFLLAGLMCTLCRIAHAHDGKAGITAPANASPSFYRRGDEEFSEKYRRAREGEFLESIKKGSTYRSDHQRGNQCYSPNVAAKSATGRRNPFYLQAIPDAESVFFCIVATAHLSNAGKIRTLSMVALVGRRSRLPVSCKAGIPTPANVTANLSVGTPAVIKYHLQEAAIMATTPTQNPQFIWLIAAVRRDMPTITAKIYHIAAETEREARRTLARDHVCFFAGRIRLEVAA